MYKFIRFYNKNRKKFYGIILIIVFLIGIIQLLNWFVKIRNKKNANNVLQNYSVVENNVQSELLSDKSVISGESISDSKIRIDIDLINKFINYCNEKELGKAYELISDECRDEMFLSIDDFKNIYYDNVFNGKRKIYTLENWVNNIYKIEINDDVLSTGIYDKQNTVIDYISVEKNGDEYKLNINKYIGKNALNKEKEFRGIKVNVVESEIYIDYISYTIDIINNSNRTILLDDISNADHIFIQDSNGIKYSAYEHELTQEELKIGIDERKKLKIKFYSKYSSSKKIQKIVFSNLILDYEKYNYLNNKSLFDSYGILEMDI